MRSAQSTQTATTHAAQRTHRAALSARAHTTAWTVAVLLAAALGWTLNEPATESNPTTYRALPLGPTAHAAIPVRAGGYSALTIRRMDGSSLLTVLDHGAGIILNYGVKNSRELELLSVARIDTFLDKPEPRKRR